MYLCKRYEYLNALTTSCNSMFCCNALFGNWYNMPINTCLLSVYNFRHPNGWNTTDWSAHRTFCFVSYILLSLRKYKYNDLLIIITINFRISLIYAKLLILDKVDQGLVFYVKKLRLLVYTLLKKLDIEMTISLHLEYERFCLQEV